METKIDVFSNRLKQCRGNWLLFLSATCFSISLYDYSDPTVFKFLVILGNWIFVFLQTDVILFIRRINKQVIWLSLFTAIGIDSSIDNTYEQMILSSKVHFFCHLTRIPNELLVSTISAFIVVGSIVYLVFLLTKFYFWFWNRIIRDALKTWGKKDYKFFCGICIFVLAMLVTCYCMTTVFISPNTGYDIMYTADSFSFINGHVWVNLFHPENDYRQPFFAVFSAPFFGSIYCVQKIFPITTSFCSILIQLINDIFFIFCFKLLCSRIFSKNENWIIVCGYVSTYAVLLFFIVPEQYQMGTAWLMIFIYLYLNNNVQDLPFSLAASMGTLTTSGAFLPFVNEFSLRNIKKYVSSICRTISFCILFLLMFNRVDVIFKLYEQKPTKLANSISYHDRLLQFVNYVAGCLFKPKASIQNQPNDSNPFVGWLLDEVNSVNWVGVFILLFVIGVCFYQLKNRNVYKQYNKIVVICFYWLVNSFVVLCLLGWGTWENGLILYSLYYGWIYFILISLGVKYISNRINMQYKLRVLVLSCLIIANASLNLWGIFEMTYALRQVYYPCY